MKFDVIFFDKVKSTQITAKKLSETRRFVCIIADEQTNGYGQRGNKWEGNTKNLAYSLILPMSLFENLYHVNILTCMAWLKVLRRLKVNLEFKWSNDLYLRGKKVGGMLNEIEGDSIINGVGINVFVAPDIEGTYKAIALRDVNKRIPDKKKLLELFLRKFEKLIEEYKKDGIDKLLLRFREHLLYIGEKVQIEFNGKIYKGKFLGVNDDGSCTLRSGIIKRKFFSGTLRPL